MLNQDQQDKVVPMAPWVARDGFIAETAIRLDKLQALIDKFTAEFCKSRETLENVRQDLRQLQRERSFEDSLRNSREMKLDEITRTVRDLKDRMNAIAGTPAAFGGLTHKNFQSVDAKLIELTQANEKVTRLGRTVVWAAAATSASVIIFAAALATRLI